MGVGGVKLAAGTSARDDTAGHDDIIASFYSQFRVEFKLLEVLGNLGEDVLEHLLRAGERPVRGMFPASVSIHSTSEAIWART